MHKKILDLDESFPNSYHQNVKIRQKLNSQLALGNQRLPARVRLPAMRRGELPAAIARPMSKRP